jgi:phytoene dehydrogenase-like protein
MHWLTGSSPKTSLYKLWRETGALDEHTPVHNRDPFFVFDHQGQEISLYRDPDKLREHLLDQFPADRREILRLVGDIKKFTAVNMPLGDLRGLKVKEKARVPLSSLLKMVPALTRFSFWSGQSAGEYSLRFKSPALRHMLASVVTEESSALALVFTLATLASGDGGYPAGGSLGMARRMADKFEALGGTLRFNSPVDRVLVRDGVVRGVLSAGAEISADAVIVTQDTLAAADALFDPPFREPWIEKMRKNTRPMVCTFVSLGVKADLSGLPENLLFTTDSPLLCGGREYRTLDINNYSGYVFPGPGGHQSYAPEGCTALTSILLGDSYDFWKQCRDRGTYGAEKRQLAESFIEILGKKWPAIRGKVAVWDVASPLTYERYLHSYRGSYMSIMEKGIPPSYPLKAESIGNLYFAGQRLSPPGGLPMAVETGRRAVQYLCRDRGAVFQGGPSERSRP